MDRSSSISNGPSSFFKSRFTFYLAHLFDRHLAKTGNRNGEQNDSEEEVIFLKITYACHRWHFKNWICFHFLSASSLDDGLN